MKSILQLGLLLSSLAAALLAPAAAYAQACIYDECSATVCNTSGTQTATNWPCDDPQTILCNAPACPACVYGPCDATVCDTAGNRYATNQPCTGPASIACAAPSCPLCTYGPCDAAVCGTSGTQTANNWPCVGEQIITCDAPACPACFYGPCDATVCGTTGTRYSVNQPCSGPVSLSCSAPACPACTYGECSATLCGTTGSQTADNQPCIGEITQACSAPACPACVYSSTCSAVCDGGVQPALNQPCTGPISLECNTHACGTPFYLRSDVGSPWGTSSNEAAMDAAFGVGGWLDERYETVDPNVLLGAVSFIFMEGSDGNAEEMEAFVDAHLSRINTFLNAGGVIFFNAAPNEGDGMGLPDGVGQSTLLNYPAYSLDASTAVPGHPIFIGPLLTSTNFTGSSFSHATISGAGITSLLDGSSGIVLAERFIGAGLAIYGGMTSTDFQDPNPEAANLRANIIAYGDAIVIPEPSFLAGLSAGLVGLSLCAAHRRRRRSKAA